MPTSAIYPEVQSINLGSKPLFRCKAFAKADLNTESTDMGRKRKTFKFSLNSNRDGHMTAAIAVGIIVAIVGITTEQNWLVYAAIVVVVWEWFATPDVDCASQRRADSGEWLLVCLIWLPFSWAVSHRSFLSHSLLIGLPFRIGYVALLIGWPLNHFTNGLLMEAAPLWPSVLTGCAIADATHLLKDGYTPMQMLFGR
mgnify:CR=1 FL=1